MHDLYLQKYELQMYRRKLIGERVKPQVSYEYYRNTFNTCFKFSFGKPRSDTCSKFNELNIKIQAAETSDKKKILTAELELHHRKAERFYDEIKKDTQHLTFNKICHCLTFLLMIYFISDSCGYTFLEYIQLVRMMGLCIAGLRPCLNVVVMKSFPVLTTTENTTYLRP